MSTRSYILGLGSGLILSAMLTLVISPHSQSSTPTSPNSPNSSRSTSQPEAQTAAQTADKSTVPSNPTNPSPSGSQNLSSVSSPSSSQAERSFVIPNGASAERIADLLVTQGFITDKASFLESVHKKGVESQFRAGTFNLAAGLTPDEVIQRLLKK